MEGKTPWRRRTIPRDSCLRTPEAATSGIRSGGRFRTGPFLGRRSRRCLSICAQRNPSVWLGLLMVLASVAADAGFLEAQEGKVQAQVEQIRYWTDPGYTRVVINLDRQVEYEVHRLGEDVQANRPPRIYIDLIQTYCSPDLTREMDLPEGPVQKIRSARHDLNTSRLVLEVRQVEEYKVFLLTEPDRIVMDLWGKKQPKEAVQEESRSTETDPVRPVVVLDPGHGGNDPGAVGRSGLQEKDVVLTIAREVKEILEQEKKATVILTRDSDRFLSLEERTWFANSRGSDLFVSIHANAAPTPQARGVETFFLDNTTDKAAIRLAALENATAPEKMTDLQRILRDLQRNAKAMDSHTLANIVQKSLLRGLRSSRRDVRDLGAKGNLFYVLMGANMPSILVEVSFITNPVEEKLLKSPASREKIARGIASGISEYLGELDSPGLVARQ